MADTGAEDKTYNLTSVLYHALQGGENYRSYISDAEGDDDLVQFFKDVQEEEKNRAQRAKKLLAQRLSSED